jgi:hypothetical protein
MPLYSPQKLPFPPYLETQPSICIVLVAVDKSFQIPVCRALNDGVGEVIAGVDLPDFLAAFVDRNDVLFGQ